MKEENYIAFEDYLAQAMSKEDMLNFEKKLASDPEFKTAFESYKDASEFLKQNLSENKDKKDFVSNLEGISTNYFNTEKEKTKPQKTFTIGRLAIAATVAVFLGLFIFNNWSNPKYQDYNNHEIISLSVRGDLDETVLKAQNAFNNRDFAEAETYFNTILKNNPNTIEVQFYKAISQIEQDKFEAADIALKQIATGKSAYKNQAIWYAALSKLKQDDDKAAIAFLKELPKDAVYYKKAQKLIDKID